MSMNVTLWALRHAPTNNATEALVLYGMSQNADDEGNALVNNASLAKIADIARCSIPEARKAMQSLKQRGIISFDSTAAERDLFLTLNMGLIREVRN